METAELERHLSGLMHAGSAPPPPDLDLVRRLGRRRRHGRRAAVLAAALVLVGAGVGGWWATARPADRLQVRAAAEDHHATAVSAYEREVLAAVPGAYEVDGTVVVPGTPRPGVMGSTPITASRLVGTPRPLGFHAYAGGDISMWGDYPALMHRNPPAGSQVLADQGAAYLGCTTWPDEGHTGADCQPSVLVRDTAGGWEYAYGLGTERFLEPGAPMEVFTSDDWSTRTWRPAVVGGFDGTTATRVVVTTVDGRHVAARTDVDDLRPGDTFFWAVLPAEAAVIRAYDASGRVVADHEVRACSDPVDCEVR